MKRKGFILIELLAVIVILAIIILIAYPIVTNTISQARYGAFGASKKGIERAAELYYASNADKIVWDNDVSYIEIGKLKEKGLLKKSIINLLNNMEISDDTKVLLYKKGRNVEYSLQLYNDDFFAWYKNEMIKAAKKYNKNLPTNIGETTTVDLSILMDEELVDELRLPLNLENRCVGYVEIEKISNDKYNYLAYVDCLTEASSFASHYVSYGGKYLDEFKDVIETSDGGYLAVGSSNSPVITKYEIGNNGKYDAIIVKFKSNGEVEWARNFGGSNDDEFKAVVEGPNGYVAVGRTSSDDGDIENYRGGNSDALIVVYDKQGNLIYKTCYGTSGGTGTVYEFFDDIIKDGDSYLIVGRIWATADKDLEGETGFAARADGIILKVDLEFNLIWRNLFRGSYEEVLRAVTKSNDNSYVIVGHSVSKDYDMEGYGYETAIAQYEGIILKYNSNDGELLKINSFKGSELEEFNDVIEVSDGYIVVGRSRSNDYDMEDLSKAFNGYADAIIIKYDKEFNLVWKKSFGGSDDDAFYSVVKHNDNEIIAVGYSKSNDMDMIGLSKTAEGYRNAILVKYNIQNGIVISKKVFGGSNSESFSSIIKTSNNQYIVAGLSYSIDKDLKTFNKGHQDAILVKYDNNLNLVKNLQEPVVIINKIKPIVPNYGTELSLRYNNIYTTNDPIVDLQNWCATYEPYTVGNTSNYYYWCLEPFNGDDRKALVEFETSTGLKFYQGEHEYLISKTMDNNHNWLQLIIYGGGSTNQVNISNFKVKFADGYVGHITDAISKGYIEPLVIVNSQAESIRPIGLMPTVIDIINENGNTGIGSYPVLRIWLKPKKSEFRGIIFTSNTDSKGNDGLNIYELRNFDMSITPTN